MKLLKLFALGLKARNLAMSLIERSTNRRYRLILPKVGRTSSLLVMILRKVPLAEFCGFFTYVGPDWDSAYVALTLNLSSIQLLEKTRQHSITSRTSERAPTVIMVCSTTSPVSSQCLTKIEGSITLLFQRAGQPGLEVLSPIELWSPVPVYPPGTETDAFPPILVNIGDLMQFWTAGVLKSTVHRVVFPRGESEDRYSIAYFCHPLDEIEMEVVPSEMIKTRGEMNKHQNGEVITAEGYLKRRLAESYGWGKEQSPSL